MNRIGFHYASGGNAQGLGEYFSKLDAAGIPAIIASYGSYGPCWELSQLSNAPHVIAFKPQLYPENPDYSLQPDQAAGILWAQMYSLIPPEFDKEKVWIIWGNEGRKELVWGDWWGWVAVEMASLAKDDGIKTLAFGWSRGTPDEGVWATPGMVSYLQWCSNNEGWAGIAVHEGSDPQYAGEGFVPLVNHIGDITGRYRHIFAECDKRGLRRPPIVITECAWRDTDAPPPDEAMEHIVAAQDLYDADGILGVCLWSLTGSGGVGEYNHISDRIQPLIGPITDYAIAHKDDVPPVVVPPPPPPTEIGMTELEQFLVETAAERPHFNNDAALQKAINATPGLRTITLEGRANRGGRQWVFQEACDEYDITRTLFYCAAGDWGNIKTVTYPGSNESAPPPTPPPPPPQEARTLLPVVPLSQRDPAWASVVLGQPTGHTKTIGSWGCLLVAYNTMARWMGLTTMLPEAFNAHMVAKGCFSAQFIQPAALRTAFPNEVIYGGYISAPSDVMDAKIRAWIDARTPVPIQVDFNPEDPDIDQHWVLVVGYIATDFIVADPWYGTIINMKSRYPRPLQALFYQKKVAPPPQTTYDLADYLRGRTAVTLRNMLGQQEEVYYPDMPGVTGGWLIAKNGLYEELRVTETSIERRVDTSPGNGESYCQFVDVGEPWAAWAKRRMYVGEVIERYPLVIFKREGDCQIVKSYRDPSQLKLHARYAQWSDPTTHMGYNDVVELHWLKDGQIIEKYFAAKYVGYIRFEASNYSSWIHEVHSDNIGQAITPSPCWNF